MDEDKIEALKIAREINDSSRDVFNLVRNLKTRLEQGELNTENGIGLLDVKNCLLAQYLANLTHLMLLKTAGKSIEATPTIERLVELRVVLERIRPIDQKLKYQIDKLVKIGLTGSANENDPGRYKANPANMISKLDDTDDGSEVDEERDEGERGGDGEKKKDRKASAVYMPPKLAAVHYDGDETKIEREERLRERARKYALNSSLMHELKQEYLDTPVEVSQSNSIKLRQSKHDKYRQEYEENYFTRLPMTKEEIRRAKKLTTVGTLADEITHFEDLSALDGRTSVGYDDAKSTRKRKSTGANKQKFNNKGKKRRRK